MWQMGAHRTEQAGNLFFLRKSQVEDLLSTLKMIAAVSSKMTQAITWLHM